MKTITILLILNGFFLVSCQKETIEGQGLEFYSVDAKFDNIKGYEFSVSDNTKLGKLLILNSEIESYSWEDQIITLNETGNSKLKALYASSWQTPFVVTINKKPIYSGWIQNPVSSIGCNWVYLMEYYDNEAKKNRFNIGFGLVADRTTLGKDPRDNAEIRAYLKKTKRLK